MMYPWVRTKWLKMDKNAQVSLKCKATLIANNVKNPKVLPLALKALAVLMNDYEFIYNDCHETYIELMDNKDPDTILVSQLEFLRLYFKQFLTAEINNVAVDCSLQTQ